jgi:uncharacterized protein YceK
LSTCFVSIRPHILILLVFLALAGCDSAVDRSDSRMTTPIAIEPEDGMSTASAVLLRWTDDPSAWHYRVQVARDRAFTDLIDELIVSVHPWAAIQDLAIDQQYFWRVRTESTDEVSAWSVPRSLVVDRFAHQPDSPRPLAPAFDARGLDTRVRIAWEPVEDAYAYHLIVTLDEDMLLYEADLENLREPYFDLDDLVLTYPYWWKVRALGPAGYSDWSSVWIFWIKTE